MNKSNLVRTTIFVGSLLLFTGALSNDSSAAPGELDLSFDTVKMGSCDIS
jgi:hypothetical protein